MPTQSYPVGGKVRDNNLVPIEGATVYLIDTTTGEQLNSEYYATTNSAGEYILNMQNLSTYSDGDGYEVIATYPGYEDGKITGTVVQSGGGDSDKNIFMDVDLNKFKEGTSRENTRESILKGFLSRFKKSFNVWVNNKTLSGSAEVLTSGGDGWGKGYTSSGKPLINLNVGEVCYVEQITFKLRTASDNVTVEVVKCPNADGGGTADPVSPQYYEATGSTVDGAVRVIPFANPIRIEYNSSSAKSVAIRVNGNDSSAKLDVSMEGYVINE